MTERMLRVSLGAPSWEPARQSLRDAALSPVLALRGLTVHAGALPLFAHGGDGALRQVVRVAVRGMEGARPRVRLRGTGAWSGETAATGTPTAAAGGPWAGWALADLLVPEVPATRLLVLEVHDGAGLVGSGEVTVTPQRKWHIHLIHHSHLDVGYTDPQGMVLRHHLEYLDSVLDLVDATAGWDDDARFRWNVEAYLPVRRWLAARPLAARRRLADAARAGSVEVSALPYSLHTEACSTEELHRLVGGAVELRERHRIPIRTAMQSDVPGATVGLVDALAGAGVRYLSVAHNWGGRSVPYLLDGQQLTRPFWWRAPSGNRLLVWHTDSAHGVAYMEGNVIGLSEGYGLSLDLLPAYLSVLARRPYPYQHAWGSQGLPHPDTGTRQPYPHDLLHLRVQGDHADNATPSIVPAEIVREWNQRWAYPHLRLSVGHDFFTAAEERLGGSLPTHEGDWTDWWADGLGSGARPLGYSRRAQNAARTAETLHTLADVRGGDRDPRTSALVADTYDKLGLFDEHSWGSGNPWMDAEEGHDSGGLQWTLKQAFAIQANDTATDLVASGVARLGATFAPEPDALASLVVVNPASAGRTEVVRAFVPASLVPLDRPVAVADGRTGAVVAHTVSPQPHAMFRTAGRWVTFTARDLDPLGYVRFDVVEGEPPAEPEPLAGDVLENDRYRVAFDLRRSVVTSVFDKMAGRELVNADAVAGWNQYVHERYTTAPGFNHMSGRVLATDLSLLGDRTMARGAAVLHAERTPVADRLVVGLQAEGADWLETTITLPHGVPRVEFTNRLAKRATSAKESGLFAFPFNLSVPPSAWELTGGVGGTSAPRVPGSARHLQAIRHWVAFEDPELSVAWATLEAPLVQLGNLHLPYAPFPPTIELDAPEPATVYSWALNNVWDTNFPGRQGGEMTFRYAVASATGTPARQLGAATAAALTDPPVAALARGAGPGEPASGSFVTLDHPDVQVTTIGTARDGRGITLLLRSVAPEPARATVGLPPSATGRARAGTWQERDLTNLEIHNGQVQVEVPPCGTVMVIVEPRG